jgi:hypothetical protein
MPDTRPTTAWAYTALACGILGWFAAAPLPFIDYGYIAGATAGVGLIGPFLLGVLSSLLGLLALVLGIVTLARTKGGGFGGRSKGWAGLALGGFLVMTYVVVAGRMGFRWW